MGGGVHIALSPGVEQQKLQGTGLGEGFQPTLQKFLFHAAAVTIVDAHNLSPLSVSVSFIIPCFFLFHKSQMGFAPINSGESR